MNAPLFLKRVLLLDAASCLGLGVMLLLGTSLLSDLFGIESQTLMLAGAILVPCGLFIAWTALRDPISPWLVTLIILVNIWWVAESLLLLGQNSATSTIGFAFVIAQALAVAGLAALETIGVVRIRASRA